MASTFPRWAFMDTMASRWTGTRKHRWRRSDPWRHRAVKKAGGCARVYPFAQLAKRGDSKYHDIHDTSNRRTDRWSYYWGRLRNGAGRRAPAKRTTPAGRQAEQRMGRHARIGRPRRLLRHRSGPD